MYRIIAYLLLCSALTPSISCDKNKSEIVDIATLKFPEDTTYTFKYVPEYYDKNNDRLTERFKSTYDPNFIVEYTFDTQAKSVKIYLSYSETGKEKIKQYYANLMDEEINNLSGLTDDEYKQAVQSITNRYNADLAVHILPLYEYRAYALSLDHKTIDFFKYGNWNDTPLNEQNLTIETSASSIRLHFDYNQSQTTELRNGDFEYDQINRLLAYRVKGYWELKKK